MKKVISIVIAVSLIFVISGCAQRKEITTTVDGHKVTHTYQPYGLFDAREHKNPNIEYEVSVGNVVWSILLIETVVAPVVLFGWYLYEPVSSKNGYVNLKGVVE